MRQGRNEYDNNRSLIEIEGFNGREKIFCPICKNSADISHRFCGLCGFKFRQQEPSDVSVVEINQFQLDSNSDNLAFIINQKSSTKENNISFFSDIKRVSIIQTVLPPKIPMTFIPQQAKIGEKNDYFI